MKLINFLTNFDFYKFILIGVITSFLGSFGTVSEGAFFKSNLGIFFYILCGLGSFALIGIIWYNFGFLAGLASMLLFWVFAFIGDKVATNAVRHK